MTLRYRILLALMLSAFVSFGHTATTAEAEPDSQPEPTANNSDTAPTQFRNIYKARAYGFGITVTHSLERTEGNQFKLRFFADSMLASIEETSLFTWPEADGLLIPQEYRYQRKGLGRNREAHLVFDWEAMKVTNNVENKPWKMTIDHGILDKVSFQVQLQHDLLAGKDQLNYAIADGGHVKEYTFEILGEERLDTPLGEIDTLKIKRSRKDSDRVTYAWMAPDYQYLLVRMQQEEDGDTYTIYIHEAEINGKAIKSFE